jgi:hypothetical protein
MNRYGLSAAANSRRLLVPPARPSPEDCCKGSCDACVFDLYNEALDRYRADLRAWEERQARRDADSAPL